MVCIDNSHVKDPIVRSLTLIDKHHQSHFITELCQTKKPLSLGFINQHAYNLIQQSDTVASYFRHLNYRLRDGAGMKIACHYNRCTPGANLNGSDFIPALVKQLLHHPRKTDFFIFGTQEPWLTKGGENLLNGCVFTALDGFAEDSSYTDLIVDKAQPSSLSVIILAMGMPKQEKVAEQLRASLNSPAIIICGGAIIDFCSGRFSRAPAVFRKLGLEWLYRLGLEPGRLFKRYVIGIPRFFYFLVKSKS